MQCVLLVEDDGATRRALARLCRRQGWRVVEADSAAGGWDAFVREGPGLVVIDHVLGRGLPTGLELLKRIRAAGHSTPVVLNTGTDDLSVIAEAIDEGLTKFIPKPGDISTLLTLLDELATPLVGTGPKHTDDDVHEIVGNSAAARQLKEDIRCFAREGTHPVLVTGPTGSGKERVAHALHRLSTRRVEPLLFVDCPTIAANLFESQLFGHEQGAFTGAVRKLEGDLQRVGAGTLVLDEVGELPLELQPKLLRVIQLRRFRPVGSGRELVFRGRFVFVTNRRLEEAVAARTFREDLFHRMAMLVVSVPALDERADDKLDIIADLARELAPGRRLSENAARALCRRAWPGNVRELQRALITLFARQQAAVVDLPPDVDDQADEIDQLARRFLDGGEQRLPVLEKRVFEMVLEQERGSIRATAARIGVSRAKVVRILAGCARDTHRSDTWRRSIPGDGDDAEETERAG